jgi:hypothetical protein
LKRVANKIRSLLILPSRVNAYKAENVNIRNPNDSLYYDSLNKHNHLNMAKKIDRLIDQETHSWIIDLSPTPKDVNNE